MSTFVHVPNRTRVGAEMQPDLREGLTYRHLNSKFGIEVRSVDPTKPPTALLISGKDAGIQVSAIAPNQRAVLNLGFVQARRYQLWLVSNPAFGLVSTVQHTVLAEPKEPVKLELVINAHKEVKLEDFEWLFRVYAIE